MLRLPDGKSELLISSESFKAKTALWFVNDITEQPTDIAGRKDLTRLFKDISSEHNEKVTPIVLDAIY